MTKLEAQKIQLSKAIQSLRVVLGLPLDDYGTVRDSAIQRFEFCVDLSWKTLKSILKENHGIECASPKECLRQAFAVGIFVEDDPFWLHLIELRNLSSHTYNEEIAEEMYKELPKALQYFENLAKMIV